MYGIVFFGSFYYGIHQHLSCFSSGYRVCFHPLRAVFFPPSMPPWIKCLGSLCSPCDISTSVILVLWVPSLPTRFFYTYDLHSLMDYVKVTFYSLLNIKLEHLFFLWKKDTEYLKMLLSHILISLNWVFYIFGWGNKLN